MKKKVVSFLASGRGSNFRIVAGKIVEGYISAELGILICDKEDAPALAVAEQFGMKAYFIGPSKFDGKKAYEEAMVTLLVKHKTDLVVTAGFMKILSPYFVHSFRNRIINIHPALLPSFPGVHAQRQAWDYGVKITGCTTHFIDEGTDTGPIILQSEVPVADDDTVDSLSARILKEEHRILPLTVKLFCEDKLRLNGRRVKVLS